MRDYSHRVGEIRTMNCGDNAIIIEYINSKNVVIKFLDEFNYIATVEYGNFCKGTIRNPYHKNVYGGYAGEGEYNFSKNSKPTRIYDKWVRMLQRSKDIEFKKRQTTYKEVDCCDEWLNFNVFVDWFNENDITSEERIELDKDWIKQGNKLYCPEYCSIVPHLVNSCILNHDKIKYDLPTGIIIHNNQYCARVSEFGKRIVLCHTDSLQEAMIKYKTEKISYINKLAEIYKKVLPQSIYNEMKHYENRFVLDFPDYIELER